MSILDHLSVGVSDVDRAAVFYDAVLETIGATRLAKSDAFVAYGKESVDFLAMPPFDKLAASSGNGSHVCFAADSEAQVRAFHAAALGAGGVCEGEPGPRPAYPTPAAYAAYVRDPFGNKLEVITGGFNS